MKSRLKVMLRTSIGFGIGGAILSLWIVVATTNKELRETFLVVPLSVVIPAVTGAIGGLALAHKRNDRSTSRIISGFGIGFSLGGFIVLFSVMGLCLGVAEGERFDSDIFYDFYWVFVLGFAIAGAVSAAIIRSNLTSVLRATVSFVMGSALGGVAIWVLFRTVWHPGFPETLPGIILSYVFGGAVIGFLSHSREDSTSDEAGAKRPV
jgi:hypothetical protein